MHTTYFVVIYSFYYSTKSGETIMKILYLHGLWIL